MDKMESSKNDDLAFQEIKESNLTLKESSANFMSAIGGPEQSVSDF